MGEDSLIAAEAGSNLATGTADTGPSWSFGTLTANYANDKGVAGYSKSNADLGTLTSSFVSLFGLGATKALGDAKSYLAQMQGSMASLGYLDQARAAIRNIGVAQRYGLDAATLRYERLSKEIAAQRVAAAGSGIDISSKTMGRIESTSRKNAAWDVEHISRQAKISADNYNDQAAAAYRNSAYARIQAEYQSDVAKIQGRLAERIQRSGAIGGLISSLSSLSGRVAGGGLEDGGAGNGFPS